MPADWNEPDKLNKEWAEREPGPATTPSPASSDAPRWTPGPWTTWDHGAGWEIFSLGDCEIPLIPKRHHGFEREDAYLISAAPDLYDACTFGKSFLTKLEEGSEPRDPLRAMRRKFHAPLHAILDAAMQKARGEHAQKP